MSPSQFIFAWVTFASCSVVLPRSAMGGTELSPYSGCVLFFDDFGKSKTDHEALAAFQADFLIRSWYRWGEPLPKDSYASRSDAVAFLKASGIGFGGGVSLSLVNERDLEGTAFDDSWLSVDLEGRSIRSGEKRYGTLSAPGFRKYLIGKAVEQAKLGATELHFGETNGKIHFDEWSLGTRGSSGFIAWIREKYAQRDAQWWKNYLGELGEAIFSKQNVSRKHFLALKNGPLQNFYREWGKAASWHGNNEAGEPAFLAWLYARNLDSFLFELRSELRAQGLEHVKLDIWGFADWMKNLANRPDAYLGSPPDERWGFAWNTDSRYPVEAERARIKKIMSKQVGAAAPSPVVYMFDHPKPFLDAFVKLEDERQAYLTAFFANLSHEVDAVFAFRSYSEARANLGPKTRRMISKLCRRETKIQ